MKLLEIVLIELAQIIGWTLGTICGLFMRIVDLITGKRKDWYDGY